MRGFWAAATSRTVRLVVCWVLCLAAAATAISFAWVELADSRRPDGNAGHVNVDFAGQWMMGRLLVAGYPAGLYDRYAHQLVLAPAYPDAAQDPDEPIRDHHRLADYLLGRADRDALRTLTATAVPLAAGSPLELAVLVAALPPASELAEARRQRQLGGPLYPPIHAYVMAPLGLLPPQPAYRTMQVANLLLAFVVGLGASLWSGGRIWWPVATVLVMVFPGYGGTINLGQNPLVSLGLLGLGSWLVSVGRPGWGGVVWGLLAFKPVWAVGFFVAAVATRRWRLALSMGATGVALILLTLPLGGLGPWFDWLELGRLASAYYDRDRNWVFISRDLQNLPRRLLTFPAEGGLSTAPPGRLVDRLGVGLWAGVVVLWLAGLLRLGKPSWDGPAGAFTLLGAWLSCWHFMYYDTLLAALPVFLLIRDPVRAGWVPWTVLVLLVGCHYLGETLDPQLMGPPCDTFLLLGLWVWCYFAVSRES